MKSDVGPWPPESRMKAAHLILLWITRNENGATRGDVDELATLLGVHPDAQLEPRGAKVESADAGHALADAYSTYAEQVLPAGAGPNQRQETRRAFFAGALAALGVMLDARTVDEKTMTHARLFDECAGFLRGVKRGRA